MMQISNNDTGIKSMALRNILCSPAVSKILCQVLTLKEIFSLKTWKYGSPFNAKSKETCTKTTLEMYLQGVHTCLSYKDCY